jgi:two-component system, cell cycle response regulator DivK
MTNKILYIEDDPEQLELVRMFVTRDGFYLLTAKDGASGLDIARREFPLLVIVDINLPVMNGIELAQHLRADAATASIPLVALTSNTKHGVLHGHQVDLFDAFLTKPVMRKDLVAQILQFIALPN